MCTFVCGNYTGNFEWQNHISGYIQHKGKADYHQLNNDFLKFPATHSDFFSLIKANDSQMTGVRAMCNTPFFFAGMKDPIHLPLPHLVNQDNIFCPYMFHWGGEWLTSLKCFLGICHGGTHNISPSKCHRSPWHTTHSTLIIIMGLHCTHQSSCCVKLAVSRFKMFCNDKFGFIS